MDYTGFLREYYISMMSRLNQFSNYKGSFALLNYSLDISEEHLHFKESNLNCLPDFMLNINAPTKEYEMFFDYYNKHLPDLAILMPSIEALRSLYSSLVFNKDDQTAKGSIDFYIDLSITALVEKGVIN